MSRITAPLALILLVALFVVGVTVALRAPDAGPAKREQSLPAQTHLPWTNSRITGSPDPPHPYRTQRVFPKLAFKNPLLIRMAPGMDRFFVGEHLGKIYSFRNDPSVAKAQLAIDLTTEVRSWDKAGKVKGVEAVYALEFHPKFRENRYCYICYVLASKAGEQLQDGSRVSRFRVTNTDPPRIDPKSEKIVITWLAGGHNGCDLHFGNDGCLYISTGDGTSPNPPDALDTGQDCSDLLSSILRIDVDHPFGERGGVSPPRVSGERGGVSPARAYGIPKDNPFVNIPGVRPEIWAYGFRNPWRMSFDRATGDLWVGDVGWELWEMVYRVQKGGNYGWSVMEGRQPVKAEGKRGPTPILPPTLDFPHTEAASITGGYVYHGKRLPELRGAYVCGDWSSRKLWATWFERSEKGVRPPNLTGSDPFLGTNGDRITKHIEIAQGNERIVAFAEDHEGELYILDYEETGGIHQLVPNEAAKEKQPPFPTKLSETGLFDPLAALKPAPGVLPYSINAEQWADFATAERLVALPGDGTIKVYDSPIPIPGGFYSGQYFFPKDGVLAKTISLEMERGKPESRRRLETQILHFDGATWHGYTYQWNDLQTDATLVPAAGADRTFTIMDPQAPGGKRTQLWHFHSRTECLTCHNPWTGHELSFTLPQLDRKHDYFGEIAEQIPTLKRLGILTPTPREDATDFSVPSSLPTRLTNPYDEKADLNERARSYLHVNCSPCHQFGAGGTADLELRYGPPLEQMKILDIRPVQGTFEIPGGRILAPGDPYRSVLYYRIAKLGHGRMPHLGSQIVDEPGCRLIHDWIRQLPLRRDDLALIEKLRALDEPAVQHHLHESEKELVEKAATAIAKASRRTTITLEDRQKAEIELKARLATQAKTRAAERTDAINRLLSSTGSALRLAHALAENRIPAAIRKEVLATAMARPEPQIRDLFERFVSEEERPKRLGSAIKPAQILALKGNAQRGRELFFKTSGVQCINCHRIAGTGSTLGPDLTQIGKKYSRAQILESILEPSKSIEPKYVTYLVETTDGQVHTGILAEKNDKEVVLRDVGDKEIRIPTNKVGTLVPQPKSLMPELLLRDLTAEQVADLLEYLLSLK